MTLIYSLLIKKAIRVGVGAISLTIQKPQLFIQFPKTV